MSQSRYDAYKDSGVAWLGQVPAHWEVVALKRTLDIQNGHDYKHIESENGYPVIGSGGIFAFASDYLFDGESILLGRKGTIDKPLHFRGKFWTVDTMFWSKIATGVYGRFIYYVATEIPFAMYSTNTALPSMAKSVLEQHLIPLPPLAEQQAIAAFLDRECARIDALVAAQQRMIALSKEKRQALISQAVTRGLDPAAPCKDSGVAWLGQVPAHWEVRKSKYLCRIQTGDKDTVNSAEDGLYPFYVRSETIERINSFTFNCEAILTAGDGAGVGKVFHHHLTGPFDFHQRVYMMNNFNSITGKFFYYYFSNNFHKVALEGGAKSTVDSLRRPMITNFELCVPPLAEQQAIAAFLDRECARIDTLIERAEQAIVLLRERRSALIAAAVTGQIRVGNEE